MTIKLRIMQSAEALAEQLNLPVEVVKDVRAGKYELKPVKPKLDFENFGYRIKEQTPA